MNRRIQVWGIIVFSSTALWGCASGGDSCQAAADHLVSCFAGTSVPVGQCDEAMAESVLQQSCEELAASGMGGKADSSLKGWYCENIGWGCDDDGVDLEDPSCSASSSQVLAFGKVIIVGSDENGAAAFSPFDMAYVEFLEHESGPMIGHTYSDPTGLFAMYTSSFCQNGKSKFRPGVYHLRIRIRDKYGPVCKQDVNGSSVESTSVVLEERERPASPTDLGEIYVTIPPVGYP
jgi:hypothetical protein